MANNIIIKYGDKKVAELNPDTPCLDDLVKFITDNQDIDISLIKCECLTDGFDSDFFEQAIKEAVTEELKCLKLEKDKFDVAMKNFDEESTSKN